MKQGDFSIWLEVDNQPLSETNFTQNQTIVEAIADKRYEVVFENRSNRRVLVELFIDGLSVVDGKPRNLNRVDGYIVDSDSRTRIPGWRISASEIASFVFSNLEWGYNAVKGESTKESGKIEVWIYREKGSWQHESYYTSKYNPDSSFQSIERRNIDYARRGPTRGVPISAPSQAYSSGMMDQMASPSFTSEPNSSILCSTSTETQTKGRISTSEVPWDADFAPQAASGAACLSFDEQSRGLGDFIEDRAVVNQVVSSADIATEFGGKQEYKTKEIPFDAEHSHSAHFVLLYRSKETIEKMNLPKKQETACEVPPVWRPDR